jgi:uncharacterized membrane protein YdjX (TVP38/TMEM64 family)
VSQRTRRLRQVVVLLCIAMAFVLPLRLRGAGETLSRGVAWAHDAGPAGAMAYGFAYVLATILCVPGLVLTLGAGFVYGPLWGTLLISPASVAGATAAFLLGRTLLRGPLVRRFGDDPRFRAVDRAVAEGGFKIVLLLRLSPLIPFNLLNYALGLTRVRPWHYVSASFLGMLPATILYVWMGSLLTSAADLVTGPPEAGRAWRLALLATGVVATVAVSLVIGRAARRALDRELHEPAGP